MFNLNEFSPGFQDFLARHLRQKDWIARYLASLAGVDEGEMSHIKRRGHVPKRSTVQAIGRALGDVDACLLAAGYLPRPNYALPLSFGVAL